jgi:DNA-binding transcriptional ArsR family regulator
MKRDVFQAIADPTRRKILALLLGQTLHLNAVAEQFAISRPAVSKHVKILTECGLVRVVQRGRERYCQAQPERLREVASWLEQYRQHWEQRLDSLEEYLAQLPPEPPTAV